jgi:hypothetical protein
VKVKKRSPLPGHELQPDAAESEKKTDSFQEDAFADVCRVLPFCVLPQSHGTHTVNMEWYSWWVCRQLQATPHSLLAVLPGQAIVEKTSSFMKVWRVLAAFLTSNPCASIDDVTENLAKQGLLEDLSGQEPLRRAKSLLFTVIGWQTMLFRADCGSCPSTNFAIADETEGYRGRSHMQLRQHSNSSRDALHKCLLGFGVLLPPPNYDLSDNTEQKQAFATVVDVEPEYLNASLLVHVGRLAIKWTDCLACHLEFDAASNSVYVFRYPSFCVASKEVPQHRHQNTSDEKSIYQGPLYACAQPSTGTALWAKPADVTSLLEEVLLSYRLIFGQNKHSRRLFRELTPFALYPAHAEDRLLHELCGRKQCTFPLPRAERKVWNLKHDFPVLRSRLSALAFEMSNRRPRTWLELWRDKRDSAQWATFWAVIVFGVISLLLSAVQVVLQAIEIGIGQ